MSEKDIIKRALDIINGRGLVEPEVWIEFGFRVKMPMSVADRINFKEAYLSQLPEGSVIRSRCNNANEIIWEYLL